MKTKINNNLIDLWDIKLIKPEHILITMFSKNNKLLQLLRHDQGVSRLIHKLLQLLHHVQGVSRLTQKPRLILITAFSRNNKRHQPPQYHVQGVSRLTQKPRLTLITMLSRTNKLLQLLHHLQGVSR